MWPSRCQCVRQHDCERAVLLTSFCESTEPDCKRSRMQLLQQLTQAAYTHCSRPDDIQSLFHATIGPRMAAAPSLLLARRPGTLTDSLRDPSLYTDSFSSKHFSFQIRPCVYLCSALSSPHMWSRKK